MAIGSHNVGSVNVNKPTGGRWRVNKLHLDDWGDEGTITLSTTPNTSVRLIIPNPKVNGNKRFFVEYAIENGSGVVKTAGVSDEALIDEEVEGGQHLKLRSNDDGGSMPRAVSYIAIVRDAAGKKHVVDPDITIRDPGARPYFVRTFASFHMRQLAMEELDPGGQIAVGLEGRIHFGPEGPGAEEEGGRGPLPIEEYFWAVFENPDLTELVAKESGAARLEFSAVRGTTYWIVLAHDPDRTADPDLKVADRLVVRLDVPSDFGEG